MKKLISCLIFIGMFTAIAYFANVQLTEILTPKQENRYYIMEKYLEDNPEDILHDVQVFGACHAYTSFNPVYMEEFTGVGSFVYANPGEIIPTTYVRMAEQFKTHVPKVAVVETWGINPYETYDSPTNIFENYLPVNLERTKLSLPKLEVINDINHIGYKKINMVSMNFPFTNYRDRLFKGTLTDIDFNYSFEATGSMDSDWLYREMANRQSNKGYKLNAPQPVVDYSEKQTYIEKGEFLEIEPLIVKYIQKIIDLCKKNDVELIFYRAPYISTANELKKLNHLQQICDENDILFIDLEKQLQYDYTWDFCDYEHLSEFGANKSTDYLLPYIMEAMGEKNWKRQPIQRTNLLRNSDFTNPENKSGNSSFGTPGETIDDWLTDFGGDFIVLTEDGIDGIINIRTAPGWFFFQSYEVDEELLGTYVTCYFDIYKHSDEKLCPVISFRNADNLEIMYKQLSNEAGEHTVSMLVPPNTAYIRVGFFAQDGFVSGDSFSVRKTGLYQGVLTLDHIHEAQSFQ